VTVSLAASVLALFFVAPANLPAPVAADLKELTDMCREAGGAPMAADAVKSADLTGDGHVDFVLFVGNVGCDGAASLFGDREKAVTVYVGDAAGGAVSVFRGMAFDAKLEGPAASPKLWLTVSGGDCGKAPAPDFANESFCDRALQWNAKARKFEYAPVSTVRMIQ
jgi:hypothetical protein